VVSAPQKIIVDGYNVIYADDSLRRHAIRDMERARRSFLGRVKSYIAGRNVQVTVVFDGRGGIADAETVVPGKLQIIYSARGQTADDLIIHMVSEAGAPQAYLVVTSDKAHIRPAVSRLGCQVIGAMSFLKRLEGAVNAKKERGQNEKPRIESDDIDYWLGEFEGGAEDTDKIE
jgi:predicted RNA-binding protein with PIN domain